MRSKDEIPTNAMGFMLHREHDEEAGILIAMRFSDGRDSRGGGTGPLGGGSNVSGGGAWSGP